ncbi:MAG: hypothetical protein ABJE66_35925 [Deltaproteobacteria bacterium]
MRHTTWMVAAVLLASATTALAELDLPDLPQLPAPKTPDTAPKLSIVAPAMDAVMVGQSTKAADDRYDSLDCLQDSKKFSIKLAAEHWPVKPGGPGVLLVVDGVYATVVHDLKKPILMADLEPYEHDSFANSGTFADQYPMYACGEHWIAVVPTTADGHMVRVPPVVSWWRNTREGGGERDEDGRSRQARLSRGLPVVNWPLLGSPYFGRTWSQTEHAHRSGRIASDPKHLVLDYTIAPGAADPDRHPRDGEECVLRIAAQDEQQEWNEKYELPPTGTVALPATYANNALAIDSEQCGGMSPYFAMLWTKKPSPIDKFEWPKPGSAQADDYWHSSEGHAQFRQHVKSSRENCAKGKGNCQWGTTKHKH